MQRAQGTQTQAKFLGMQRGFVRVGRSCHAEAHATENRMSASGRFVAVLIIRKDVMWKWKCVVVEEERAEGGGGGKEKMVEEAEEEEEGRRRWWRRRRRRRGREGEVVEVKKEGFLSEESEMMV